MKASGEVQAAMTTSRARVARDVGQRFLKNAKHRDVAVTIPGQVGDPQIEAARAFAPFGELVNK
jgi:hypothetical protein